MAIYDKSDLDIEDLQKLELKNGEITMTMTISAQLTDSENSSSNSSTSSHRPPFTSEPKAEESTALKSEMPQKAKKTWQIAREKFFAR
jgi:hypothetical protein